MSDVRGLGMDLCAIDRMAKLLDDDRFLTRFFSPEEAAYVRRKGVTAPQTLAGMFAAKEATLKALGVGLTVPLTDVEISHTEAGQPICHLYRAALDAAQGGYILLTITHDAGMAAASAVWLTRT